jgi:hypothetical protein
VCVCVAFSSEIEDKTYDIKSRQASRSPGTIVDFGFPNSFKTEPWLSGGRKGGEKKLSSTYVKMHNMLTDQYKLDECGKMHLLTW